jgi:hypothetical protein
MEVNALTGTAGVSPAASAKPEQDVRNLTWANQGACRLSASEKPVVPVRALTE